MAGNVTRRVLTAVVVFAALLQLASIATPGWMININKYTETYISLFYQTKCMRSHLGDMECTTESFKNAHIDLINELDITSDAHKGQKASIDYRYNKQMLKQIIAMVALAMVLLVAFSAMISHHFSWLYENTGSMSRGLTVLSASCLSISSGLMLVIVCRDFVDVAYLNIMKGLDDEYDNTYVGFPYSLILYAGAVFFQLVAVLFFIRHEPRTTKLSEKVNRDEIVEMKSAPMKMALAPTNLEVKCIPADKGKDNPAYPLSEHL